MSDQTPEARLAAALDALPAPWSIDPAPYDSRRDFARAILAADPTLAADLALVADIRERAEEPEGTWFTTDSLAAALHEADKEPGDDRQDLWAEGGYYVHATAIIQAAKEAERE